MSNKKKTGTFRISASVLLFILVFVYLLYHTAAYLTRDRVSFYEIGTVVSLENDKSFTGLILRDEHITAADYSGYINFYVRDGERAAVNDLICSIDESGRYSAQLMAVNSGTSSLTNDELSELSSIISRHTAHYDPMSFGSAYDLKKSLDAKLLRFLSYDTQADLNALNIDASQFHVAPASETGIIELSLDGMEALTEKDICAELFDRSAYERTTIAAGERIDAGTSIYKTVVSELWDIVIPLTDLEAEEYRNSDRLSITLPELGVKTTMLFREFLGSDGKTYGKLTTSKYMIDFAEERFIDIVVNSAHVRGIKIPETALSSMEFYRIPIDYAAKGGNTSSTGFNKEIDASGGKTIDFIVPTIKYKDENYYYILMSDLDPGTVLVKPDSADRYTVAATDMFKGVYNVNKGYAVFRPVEILEQSDGYIIAKEGVNYSAAVFDLLLLDGSLGEEGKIIYQ